MDRLLAQEIEWIKHAQQGESEAFGPLVQRSISTAYSPWFIIWCSRSRDEVEDLAQGDFYQGLPRNPELQFSVFVRHLAQPHCHLANHCYDYLRHERASRVSFFGKWERTASRNWRAMPRSKPEQALDHEEQTVPLKDLVDKLLNRASESDRTILVMKELHDYSVEEIAEILKSSSQPPSRYTGCTEARKRMLEDLRHWREESKGHAM